LSIARSLPLAFQMVYAAAPKHTLIVVALTLLSGTLPIAMLAATKPMVNAVSELLRDPSQQWEVALGWVGVMAGLIILTEAIASLLGWLRLGQSELVSLHVRGLVQAQSSRVAMTFYEQPDYFDQLHRARDAATERPVQLLEGVTELGRSAIAILGVGAILASYVWWLPLLLALAMLPALLSALAHAWRQHQFAIKSTTDERRARYFDWLLTERDAAAEIRALGLSAHFRRLYSENRLRIRDAMLALHGREAWAKLGLAFLALAAAGCAVLWMVAEAVQGSASIGDVALCYQAFVQASALSRSAVGGLGAIYRNALFLEDFFRFLALPGDPVESIEDHGKAEARAAGAGKSEDICRAPQIRFESVTFSYPGVRQPALRDCTLTVEPGSVIALLGPNGAGKSTLVKLLCRFYSPDSGRLTLDDVDISEMPVEQLRRSISVMFQWPLDFSGTVAENILPLTPENHERIQHGLDAAQADALVRSLPDGMQSRLATLFPGGTELSGGEWQRLAIARAFARDASVLVFDEPTSAMDPWAEREWLRNLRKFADRRTVILITHRLSTAAEADVIHVMESGRVVESGSHDDLIRGAGPYANLWKPDGGPGAVGQSGARLDH